MRNALAVHPALPGRRPPGHRAPSRPCRPAAEVTAAAPAGARPLLVAALAPTRTGAPGARRHRDRPRGRGPRRRARRACSAPDAVGLLPGAGRRCRTSGSARAATPSAGGSPCCAGSRHPDADDADARPARGRRRAGARRAPAAWSRASATSSPVALAGRRRRRRSSDVVERLGGRGVHPRRPGRAARRVRRARRHPRRLPADRGAPAAGRVLGRRRSRRSAGSRSPTSARLEVAEHGLWAPPCRELLLTDDVRARAAALGRRSYPAAAELLDKLAEGIAVEGMESLAPALVDEHGAAASTCCPTARTCSSLRPRAGAHAAPTTSSPPARSSSRPAWADAAERQRRADRPRRVLGTASYRDARPSVREHAARAGPAPGGRVSPFGIDDEPADDDGDVEPRAVDAAPGRGLPRRHRARASPTSRGWLARRLARRRRHRGPRPGRAHRRGARRARRRRRGSSTTPSTPTRARRRHRHHRLRSSTASSTPARGSPCSPRPTSPGQPAVDHGHAPDAVAPPQRSRPARSCKPGDYVVHEQHGVGRFVEMMQRDGRTARPASTSSSSTRLASAASPATGSSCRPTSSTRSPATSAASSPRLHRLGGADWAKTQGPRPQGGPRDRRRADPALRRPAWRRTGHAFGAGHPVAARARGRLPVRRDARPAGHHRRGQGRHGAAGPDGPAGLRRRRLRQDRDRGARGVQGGAGRQAGRRPGADDAARAAAPRRPSPSGTRGFPVDVQALSPVPDRQGGQGGRSTGSPTARSTSSSAPTGCSAPRSRFKDLGLVIVDEEQRFGVEHKEQLKRLRTNVDVLAMSATPIPRTLEMAVTGIREMSTIADPARGAAPGAHLRRRLRRDSRSPPRSAASCCARARSSTSTTGSSRSSRPPRSIARAGARGAGRRRRTARWASTSSSRSSSTSGRSGSTCWSARRSSRPASTSPTPTR